ncbi:MAG: CAP domain-containing protein [Myxococcaceae bacterium]|nr:CAP domain-containing protein [Myxococcaceae bacterium]MCI0671606.1 CAP domain-containing protein [Myxococcaceae bacterium]
MSLITPRPLAMALLAITACNPATVGGVDAGTLDTFGNAFLAAHNRVRSDARPTPTPALSALTWSPTLASHARQWAERCTFTHSTGDLGENLFAASGGTWEPEDVVQVWAGESARYDLASNGCSDPEGCGHYTQLVWRATTEVGCGHATCDTPSPVGSPWRFWVCNYASAGNVVGQRPY